jgi:hypothetical protein
MGGEANPNATPVVSDCRYLAEDRLQKDRLKKP